MATNTLKTRIQHKNGLPAEWEQATNFVPLKGELIVYNDATAPKIKIGDGSTLVGNLPFVGGSDGTNYLPLTGGTVTADLKAQGQFQTQSTSTHQYPGLWFRNDENADIGAVYMKPSSNNNLNIRWKRDDGSGDGFYYIHCKAADGSVTAPGILTATSVYGAVWNDYAEYRNQNETIEPGYIAYCDDDGKLKKTTERLQKYEGVVSDTFGFAIGKTDDCQTPLAVSGRALVYCDPEEEHFHSGDCVCAGPDGLAYRMTREEIIEFPERIVGVVSEIPTYETWGTGNVEVDGRIWIKVR